MRNIRIDLAKGIGIILVVWGHWLPNPPFFREIFLFHMALFMIISGSFFKLNKGFDYIFNRTIKLLIPVVFFFILFTTLSIIRSQIGSEKESLFYILSFVDIYKPFQRIDPPLWFLISLLINSILLFSVKSINQKYIIIISLILSFIATKCNQLPLYLNQTLATFPFFYMGFLFKDYIKGEFVNYKLLLLNILVFLLILIVNTHNINIHELEFGNNFIFYIGAGISGSLIVIDLCKSCKKYPNIIIQLGCNSLMIMCIHQPIRIYFIQSLNYIDIKLQYIRFIFEFFFFIILLLVSHYIGLFLKRRISFFN